MPYFRVHINEIKRRVQLVEAESAPDARQFVQKQIKDAGPPDGNVWLQSEVAFVEIDEDEEEGESR